MIARSVLALFSSLLTALFIFSIELSARAHEVGLSRGEYSHGQNAVSARLVFSRRELMGAIPRLDENKDGLLDSGELVRSKAGVRALIADQISVISDQNKCALEQFDSALAEEDGISVSADFVCSSEASARLTLSFFNALPHGHRHIARTQEGEHVLFKANPTLSLPNSAPSGPAQDSASPGSPGLSGLFLMGIEHILIGFDHLAFLLGLVLVGGKLRSLLWVVSAFTLAHSITLGLATLGIVTLGPRIVEPLIALSIVYVGIENFFVKDAEARWRITFPFGLIHGFGFAGALAEIKLPQSEIAPALLLFNLGVEAGQIAVIALALPLLIKLQRKAWFEDKGKKALNIALIVAGLFWFVTRVLASG